MLKFFISANRLPLPLVGMKSLYSFLPRANSASNVKLSVSTATNRTISLSRLTLFLKTIALALALLVQLVLVESSHAQCYTATNGLWPTAAFTPTCTGAFANITTSGYASEYSNVNLVAGTTYTFKSSVTTDYITVDNNGATPLVGVIGVSGTAGINWTCTASGTYRFYTHTNSACGAASVNRTRSISCAGAAFNPCTTIPTLTCGAAATSYSMAGSAGVWNTYGGAYSVPGQEKLFQFTPTVTGSYAVTMTVSTGYNDFFWKAASVGCNATSWTYVNDILGTETWNVTLTAGVAYYFMMDDEDIAANTGTISVACIVSCLPPTALTSSSITSTTATISWTAASPAPSSGYQYYVSTSSTAPLAGTTPTGSVGAGITTANLTGLTANTTYYYWVRGDCGGSGSSTWAGSSNFFTGVTNNIPFSGSSSVACGTSTLIYDHAGASTVYSINANGYIVLNNNVGSTSVISLTGTYTTELSWDFLRIYNGTGTAGTLIASYSGSGTIIPFTSSAGQTITVQFTSDGSTNASGISLNAAYSGSCAVPVCSGTPTPGNTISSPSFVAAPSGNVNLSLQNATVGTGVTYQWESSTSQTGTYTNIVGATSSTYTATVSSVTWFRCIVTCSGNSGTSAPVQVTLTACIPTMTYGCTDGDVIARVILNTLDNNSGTGCPSGTLGYSNYTSNPALTTTLLPSTSYNCIVYAGQYAANYAAWIDYNDNLIFEASERIGYTLSTVAGSGAIGVLGSSASFPVTLACTPAAGQHLLRIREVYNQTSGITITPCGNNEGFGYGEIEDYMITIAPAPACATPGLVSSVTPSSNSVALTWATSCSSALSYDFQYGPAGFTLGSGTLVSNQTVTISAPNASYTVTGLQAGTNYDIYYRANCGSSTSAWSLTSNFSTPNSVSAASSTPTLCQGTVLTSITHNTQGATGIGTATGLPAGVTATWASNTITISGTPSASGTFNYSIPLTGGFGSLNATGTITVLAAPIAPTATSPQVFCETANATIASLQVSGAAGSTFAWYTAATSGVALSSSTALSIGTTNYFVESIGTNGCVSLTRTSVSVTENPLLSASVSITGTTACPGGVLLFTSTPVNGGTNPTFQWYNNGLVIPNETASTYSASGLLAGDVINVKMIPSGSCVTVCP